MSQTALGRLAEERKAWRKDHPIGFVATPRKNSDGSMNLMVWDCKIPGKRGLSTMLWVVGFFFVRHCGRRLIQPENAVRSWISNQPPECFFEPPLFHPNIFTGGKVCLSILGGAWCSAITVKQILIGIQELLNDPNRNDPANRDANVAYTQNVAEYHRRIKEQAQQFKDPHRG